MDKEVRRLEWPGAEEWAAPAYANTVLMNHTPWDFTIFLGRATIPPQLSGHPETQEAVDENVDLDAVDTLPIEPVVAVSLSPRCFKEAMDVMQIQWKAYVAEHGRPAGVSRSK